LNPMKPSWFENLILLIAGILGCPAYENLGAFPAEPVRVVAGGTLSVRASRGVRGAMPLLARRLLRPSAGR
jgi:hypothetical protein